MGGGGGWGGGGRRREQVSSSVSDLVKVSLSVGHKSVVQRYIQFSDTFWRFLSIIK